MLNQYEQEGFNAFNNGIFKDENPYDNNTEEYNYWVFGWVMAYECSH